MSVRAASLAAVLAAALLAAGCGLTKKVHVTGEPRPAAEPKLPSPKQFLSVDRANHSVTITLIAEYDGTNSGFNFDGYSRFLMWTVPRGWKVNVLCHNRGPMRHSCAVVTEQHPGLPAFPGAHTPLARIGLEQGHSASFHFRATTPGVYRFACLVPGHEAARMWDVLRISRSGRPSVTSLEARL